MQEQFYWKVGTEVKMQWVVDNSYKRSESRLIPSEQGSIGLLAVLESCVMGTEVRHQGPRKEQVGGVRKRWRKGVENTHYKTG